MARYQSSVPDLGAGLKTAIEAQFVTDGLTTAVTDGPPPPGTIDNEEWLAILEADGEVTIQAMARTQPRDERYSQHIQISVVYETVDDQAAATARAYTIYGSVETLLRANPTLAGFYNGPGQLVSVVPGRFKFARRAESQRRESCLDVWLNVHARPQ